MTIGLELHSRSEGLTLIDCQEYLFTYPIFRKDALLTSRAHSWVKRLVSTCRLLAFNKSRAKQEAEIMTKAAGFILLVRSAQRRCCFHMEPGEHLLNLNLSVSPAAVFGLRLFTYLAN